MSKNIDVQEVADTSRGVPAYADDDLDFTDPSMDELAEDEFTEKEAELENEADESRRADIEEFDTGSVRDSQDGKPRYDLISAPALKRLAQRYADGAELYGDNNWKKGQPFSRVYASLFRHLIAWRNGETDEDHLAAVAWNAFALMHFEEVMPELDDLDA